MASTQEEPHGRDVRARWGQGERAELPCPPWAHRCASTSAYSPRRSPPHPVIQGCGRFGGPRGTGTAEYVFGCCWSPQCAAPLPPHPQAGGWRWNSSLLIQAWFQEQAELVCGDRSQLLLGHWVRGREGLAQGWWPSFRIFRCELPACIRVATYHIIALMCSSLRAHFYLQFWKKQLQ